jgi:Family of unknown function (DUF6929)
VKQQSADLEDLPPLDVRPLRELDLKAPSAPGRHACLAAASGVVRRGDFVYAIGDDELFLGVFRLSDPGPGSLRRVLSGDLPTDEEERTRHKADLEALTLLPPFGGAPFGALLGLGSGSGEVRDRGFVWMLSPDGGLRHEPSELDLGPLYDLLRREHIPELNIEGAAVIEDRLWLLQRGNTDEGLNLVAELSLSDVMASLQRDLRIDAHELEDVRSYDLGELDGVRLTFSDATPLGRDMLVFTASAEGEGGIHGSVVGTLDANGAVERLRTIDRRYKVEGVHASIDTGVVDLLFVCDQDEPGTASPLLSAAMPLEGRFERDDPG